MKNTNSPRSQNLHILTLTPRNFLISWKFYCRNTLTIDVNNTFRFKRLCMIHEVGVDMPATVQQLILVRKI